MARLCSNCFALYNGIGACSACVCPRCDERPATVHITEIIKKRKTETHLCVECARERAETLMALLDTQEKRTPCSTHKGFIEDCGCAPSEPKRKGEITDLVMRDEVERLREWQRETLKDALTIGEEEPGAFVLGLQEAAKTLGITVE